MFKEYFTICQSPSGMYKKLCETEGESIFKLKIMRDRGLSIFNQAGVR